MKKIILFLCYACSTSFEETMIYFNKFNPKMKELTLSNQNKLTNTILNITDNIMSLELHFKLEANKENNTLDLMGGRFRLNINPLASIIGEFLVPDNTKGYTNYQYDEQTLSHDKQINEITLKATNLYLQTLIAQERYKSQLKSFELMNQKYELHKNQQENINQYQFLKLKMERNKMKLSLRNSLNRKMEYETEFKQMFYLKPGELTFPKKSITSRTSVLTNRQRFIRYIKKNNLDIKEYRMKLNNNILYHKFSKGVSNLASIEIEIPSFFKQDGDGPSAIITTNIIKALKDYQDDEMKYYLCLSQYKHHILNLEFLIKKHYAIIDNSEKEIQECEEYLSDANEIKTLFLDNYKKLNELSIEAYLDALSAITNYESELLDSRTKFFTSYFKLLSLGNMLTVRHISPVL